MKRIKRAAAVLLALSLIFALSITAFAADGDLTITSSSVIFTNDQVDVYNPAEGVNYPAYSATGLMPTGTDLKNLSVTISFEGTALKIDGTTVTTASPYTTAIDFEGVSHEIEVVYASGSHIYNAAALIDGGPVSATIYFDYSNLEAYANVGLGNYYGTSGWLDAATQTQIDLAAAGVDALDAKVQGNYSDTYTMTSGQSARDILTSYATAKALAVVGGASYVSAIEGVDMDSSGMCYDYGTGGWMYAVTRGGETFFPSVAANLWKLQPGDVITWCYTCDWGYDVGYPMF